MKDKFRILAINPGSTSTKVAVYDNEQLLYEEVVRYSNAELAAFTTVIGQYQFRKNGILTLLAENNIAIDILDAVVGRGGLLKPIEGGTYAVNETMIKDLRLAHRGSMLRTWVESLRRKSRILWLFLRSLLIRWWLMNLPTLRKYPVSPLMTE